MFARILPLIIAVSPSSLMLGVSLALVASSLSAADVQWLRDYPQAQRMAAESGRPLLIHFYSNNCPPCKLLDNRAFKTPELIDAMASHVVAVKVNVDDHRDIADHHQVTRWPTDIYLASDGTELHRMVSPQDPTLYRQVVERVSMRNRDFMIDRNARLLAQRGSSQPSQPNLLTPPAPSIPTQPTAGHLASFERTAGSPTAASSVSTDTSATNHSAATTTQEASKDELPPVVAVNRYRTQPNPFAASKNAATSAPVVQNNPYAQGSMPNPTQAPAMVPPSIPAFQPPQGLQAPQNLQSPQGSLAVSKGVSTNMVSGPTTRSLTDPQFYAPSLAVDPNASLVPGNTPSTPSASIPAIPSMSARTAEPSNVALKQPEDASGIPPSMQAESTAPAAPDAAPVFDGCCPVALALQKKWLPGNAQYGVKHRGRIYHCESEEARQEFLRNPDAFSPVFSGYDLVEFLEKGIVIEGKREYGCWLQGQVYLFATQASNQRFLVAQKSYLEGLEQVQNTGRVAEAPQGAIKR